MTTPPCRNPDGHALASAVGFGGDQTGERESGAVTRSLFVTNRIENFPIVNGLFKSLR